MILDTNALSAFVDGEPALGRILSQQPRVALPVIVLGEFRYGISQSRYRAAYESWLSTHLTDFDILDVTDETASAYADVRAGLKRSGKPIPANDAWIAALAIQHRLPLLTRDEHFGAVVNLEHRSW